MHSCIVLFCFPLFRCLLILCAYLFFDIYRYHVHFIFFQPCFRENFNNSLRFAVVILVPTRELALQTSQVCKELGKHLKIQVMVTTGGTSLKDDIVRLYQPVHLLVGTPGRILDLTKKGVCILKDCSMLIMDEVIYLKRCRNAIILLHVNGQFYQSCAACNLTTHPATYLIR